MEAASKNGRVLVDLSFYSSLDDYLDVFQNTTMIFELRAATVDSTTGSSMVLWHFICCEIIELGNGNSYEAYESAYVKIPAGVRVFNSRKLDATMPVSPPRYSREQPTR